MKKFRVLMYEDTEEWKIGFEFNVKPKLAAVGIELVIMIRSDGDRLMEDLEFVPHLILVDHDLGEKTGEEIIQNILYDPQHNSTSIYFYSGGLSREELKAIVANYLANIPCFTKADDEIERSVINKAVHLKDSDRL